MALLLDRVSSVVIRHCRFRLVTRADDEVRIVRYLRLLILIVISAGRLSIPGIHDGHPPK